MPSFPTIAPRGQQHRRDLAADLFDSETFTQQPLDELGPLGRGPWLRDRRAARTPRCRNLRPPAQRIPPIRVRYSHPWPRHCCMGFRRSSATGAHTLILGNMLSVMSVASQQYYGNPRNAFWRITGELFGFAADDPYDDRTAALSPTASRCGTCSSHAGALAAWIRPSSRTAWCPTISASCSIAHPGITRVFFNGAAAEKNFNRLVRVARMCTIGDCRRRVRPRRCVTRTSWPPGAKR